MILLKNRANIMSKILSFKLFFDVSILFLLFSIVIYKLSFISESYQLSDDLLHISVMLYLFRFCQKKKKHQSEQKKK